MKAIIFDLGGVVLTNDWDKNYLKYVREFTEHFKISPEDMDRAWKKFWHLFRNGKITEDEFWRMFLTEANVENPEEKVEEAKRIWRKHQKAHECMLSLIKTLKRKYRVVALTNLSKEWYEFKVRKFNLLNYFDFIVSSGHFGKDKSGKEIYLHTLKRLNIPPEECLFIDDRERNVKIARDIGMRAILFKDASSLKRKLKELSIL